MRARRAYARRPLPPPPVLLVLYLDGETFASLGDRYGWHQDVVRRHVRAEALARGLTWPLRTQSETLRLTRRDVVDARLAASTLLDLRERYRISLLTVARRLELNETVVRGIAGGLRPRVARATQGKILELAAQLDSGELVLPRERVRRRDAELCPAGHRYNGARDARGYRVCLVCRAAKNLRQYPTNRARRQRQAEEKRRAL